MKLLLSIVVLALLAGPVYGQSFDAGRTAAQTGDYAAAVREWQPLAEGGDAQAQYNLGVMHENGEGVAADDVAASQWYAQAADQWHAKAQNNLAVMLSQGENVPRDDATALMWFIVAEQQGFAGAKRGRELVARRLSPDQIGEAERQAREKLDAMRR